MTEPRTLLVTGATGLIGGEVARHFGARGWHVRALARKPPPAPGLGVSYLPYAFDRPPTADQLAGVQALVHCAYAKGDFALNLAAAEALLRASREAGVRQKVFLSSLSARSDARAAYGRQKLAIERLFADEGGVVLRVALVIGPGGLFAAMRKHLHAGRPVPVIDGGRQPMQVVAIADLVRAIELVIDRDLRGSIVVAHPDPVPFREFYRVLAARMGVRPHFVPLPYHLVSSALFLAEAVGMRLPVDRDSLLGLRTMSYVDPRADLERLGFDPRSFEQALKELSP